MHHWITRITGGRDEAFISPPVLDVVDLLEENNRSFGFRRRLTNMVDNIHIWHSSVLWHCCWSREGGRPCCSGRAEAVEKLSHLILMMFVMHLPPLPQLRDYLGCRRALAWLTTGCACAGVLPRLLAIPQLDEMLAFQCVFGRWTHSLQAAFFEADM